jgi:hypothetical protein
MFVATWLAVPFCTVNVNVSVPPPAFGWKNRPLVRQLGRKARKGVEPNDRHDSPDVELAASRLRPHTLDELLRDDERAAGEDADDPSCR